MKNKEKISRVATPAGFEPATVGLEGRCSIHLSYGAVSPFGLEVRAPAAGVKGSPFDTRLRRYSG